MGVDFIEPDLVVTRDGVLVARHDVTLNTSTDVATHPEFAGRKRAGENGDGEAVAADWFICDFTLAELKTLRAKSPNHPAAQVYDGLFRIATFQEILDLIALKAQEAGYVVAVYPETKNPSYHLNLWKNGLIPVRLEDRLVATLEANGLNKHNAPVFVQSFEPTSLQYMRSIRLESAPGAAHRRVRRRLQDRRADLRHRRGAFGVQPADGLEARGPDRAL
jgi:glycerophosphoryl diester phosphodiesterase